LDGSVPISNGLPHVVIDDAKLRHVLRDPHRLRVRSRDALAGVGILQEPLPVPDHATDVQLVVQDAEPAFRVAVNRTRAPERTLWTGDAFLVECLCDLLGRGACGVIAEDSPDDGRFFVDDFALAGRDHAILETTQHAIAVAEAATGLAILDAPA